MDNITWLNPRIMHTLDSASLSLAQTGRVDRPEKVGTDVSKFEWNVSQKNHSSSKFSSSRTWITKSALSPLAIRPRAFNSFRNCTTVQDEKFNASSTWCDSGISGWLRSCIRRLRRVLLDITTTRPVLLSSNIKYSLFSISPASTFSGFISLHWKWRRKMKWWTAGFRDDGAIVAPVPQPFVEHVSVKEVTGPLS